MTSFQRLKQLLSQKQKKKILLLLIPMSITALFNIIGVAFIMPFLAIVAKPSIVQSDKKFSMVYHYLNFSNELNFTIFVGCLAFAALIATNLFSIFTTWLSARVVTNATASLKKDLYDKYLRSSYEFHLNKNGSTLVNNLFVLIPSVCVQYIFPGVTAVSSLISVAAIIALVLVINQFIALTFSVVFGSAYVLLFQSVKKRLASNSQNIVDSRVSMQRHASETFGGIKDIKLRRSESTFENYFTPLTVQEAKCDAYNRAISQTPKYALEMLAFGGIVLMIILMLLSGKGVASIISTTAVYVYAGYRLMPALQLIFFGVSSMRSASADIEAIHNSMQEITAINNAEVNYNESLMFSSCLQLKHICYSYPGHSRLVLQSVDIRVNYNQTVGIVGTTGAGKTTLIDIILGLLKPTGGAMYLDGADLGPDENLAAWQRKIGYVPQHIFLADTTIRENIAFGLKKEDIDDERVREAAQMAALSGFIEQEAPDGYHTVVGERGVKLSGGQLQRIGIARALYQKPSVLVLDEATSSLDNETEADVMRAIYSMKDKITMIVIAHRLSTVAACDKIYKLEKGRVVAEGESLQDLDLVAN